MPKKQSSTKIVNDISRLLQALSRAIESETLHAPFTADQHRNIFFYLGSRVDAVSAQTRSLAGVPLTFDPTKPLPDQPQTITELLERERWDREQQAKGFVRTPPRERFVKGANPDEIPGAPVVVTPPRVAPDVDGIDFLDS